LGASEVASNTKVGFGSLQPPTPPLSATIDASANVTNLRFRFSRVDGIDMRHRLDSEDSAVN
jgi:hypothetical protein